MPKTGNQITFIERLGPNCALGADDYQWIVLKVHGPASEHGLVWQGLRWDAVGFIANSKRALIACLKDKGLKLSPAGRDALARQDERIWTWRRPSA